MDGMSDYPTFDELNALRMASERGRCPLVRALDAGVDTPVDYEPVDGWLPMPDAVRSCVRKGWMTLDPPVETDGVIQHGVITTAGDAVLDLAKCKRCGLLLVEPGAGNGSRALVCAPELTACWEPHWSDGVVTHWTHIAGQERTQERRTRT